jgi:hypothetical protein
MPAAGVAVRFAHPNLRAIHADSPFCSTADFDVASSRQQMIVNASKQIAKQKNSKP